MTHFFIREWLSGRASPCQGEGREFESRLALFISGEGKKEASNIELLQFMQTTQKSVLTRIIFYFQTEWRSVSGATPVFN